MFRICRIIAETDESSDKLKDFLGGYPVEVSIQFPEEDYYEVPTLAIGWDTIKNRFPNQKINDSEVVKNLRWTYSESEAQQLKNAESFYRVVENFVNENIKSWLPSDFSIYDAIMHGDFSNFIKSNINSEEIVYAHFNRGAMYIRNDGKNFIINIKSLWVSSEDYRVVLSNFLEQYNCVLYSYNNLEEYVDLDLIGNVKALDIIRWVKYGVETPVKYFQIIPNIDINKYIPFMMSMVPVSTLELDEEERAFFERMCFKDKIARWMSTRYVSFSYDFNKNLDFLYRTNAKLAKLNYSTKKTITGRIPCNDRYNPQNLSKDGDERAKIVSRFRGGRVYQFDYTSFEARIAIYLSGNEYFIQDYYDKDIHSETAIIIFETLDFTDEQREAAKLANMAIMYGASEATAIKILSKFSEPHEKLLKIKEFLAPVFNKAKEIIEESNRAGYLINKWGSIIKPEKDYAGFNNYLQSTASEIMVDKAYEIKNLLKGYKSEFMFQVHDSLVFDIHPDESELVEIIAKIMSYNRGMLFTVNYKSGPNYKDLSSESVYF